MRRAPKLISVKLAAVSMALASGLLLTACGSGGSGDSGPDGAASETAAGQTYDLVSDAEVAAGFAKVNPLVATTAQQVEAGNTKDAEATVTDLYTVWYTFEGTVRKVDQSRYLDLEDALGALKTAAGSKDSAKAAKAAQDFVRVAAGYLAAHPTGSADVANEVAAALSGPATGVDVQLVDFAIVGPSALAPGAYEFTLDNVGKVDHEFVVFRTDLEPADVPLDAEGRVDEKGAGMALVDEKEDIKVGTTAKLRVELPAGRYLFACNVLDHWTQKMYKVVDVG